MLIWYSGKEEKLLKLSHVSRIIPGQRTVSLYYYAFCWEKKISCEALLLISFFPFSANWWDFVMRPVRIENFLKHDLKSYL